MASGPTHAVAKVGAEDKDNTSAMKAKHGDVGMERWCIGGFHNVERHGWS